jgi:hypothetical protein
MSKNETGSTTLGVLAVLGAIWFMFWFLPSLRIEASEQSVSGIVYNTSNNAWLSGSTEFSVRASEDTYVSKGNQSSYCLPPNSQYIELVSKASQDKNIKVIVTTKKIFYVASAPWVCADNVTVKQLKSNE